MVRSKRLKPVTEENQIEEGFGYCRKCRLVKRESQFHKAVDLELDSNNLFSVCKTCINAMYENILINEGGSIQKTILKMCRMLNVKFDNDAIAPALQQIKTREWDENGLFGVYRSKLVLTQGKGMTDAQNLDLTFDYDNSITIVLDETLLASDESQILEAEHKDLKVFWGDKYTKDDYEFLEKELSEWKRSYSCQNKGEEFILKELSYKGLELKIARDNGGKTEPILKAMQDIMKTGALTPAQTNMASSGKNADTLGNWIKDIENLTPAEWVKDKSAFRDVDNLEEYTETYIVSPMRSFVTGSKEFNIEGTDIDDDEEE